MSLFNNTSFRLLQQGLDATWLKQQVISNNIANADTDGYKAKTVNFYTTLKSKCKCPLHPKDDNKSEEINLIAEVTTEDGTNQTLNGNNVDMEKEQLALVDAQYQYEALVGKINNDFKMIRTAISR